MGTGLFGESAPSTPVSRERIWTQSAWVTPPDHVVAAPVSQAEPGSASDLWCRRFDFSRGRLPDETRAYGHVTHEPLPPPPDKASSLLLESKSYVLILPSDGPARHEPGAMTVKALISVADLPPPSCTHTLLRTAKPRGKVPALEVLLNSDGSLSYQRTGDGVIALATTGPRLVPGQWHLLGLVVDAAQGPSAVRTFVDGEEALHQPLPLEGLEGGELALFGSGRDDQMLGGSVLWLELLNKPRDGAVGAEEAAVGGGGGPWWSCKACNIWQRRPKCGCGTEAPWVPPPALPE
jgi:hypothetical protein